MLTERELLELAERGYRTMGVRRRERGLNSPVEANDLRAEFARDDPGHPLGAGVPLGHTLREDGDTHREAWMRVIRLDPCAYCDRSVGGTVDHIEPRSKPARGIGGAHTVQNYSGSCDRCNQRKGSRSLLDYLWRRSEKRVWIPGREVEELELALVA